MVCCLPYQAKQLFVNFINISCVPFGEDASDSSISCNKSGNNTMPDKQRKYTNGNRVTQNENMFYGCLTFTRDVEIFKPSVLPKQQQRPLYLLLLVQFPYLDQIRGDPSIKEKSVYKLYIT